MHDCRTTRSRMVDLVFDELKADEKLRLMSELETCVECLGEYRSMNGTLLIFDAAIESTSHDEGYWQEQHERLRLRLHEAASSSKVISKAQHVPVWKRIFETRLRVPLPVAAAIILALLASIVMALLRPSVANVTLRPAPAIVLTEAPPRTIEVPVFRERVVTRTVYVEKKSKEKGEARRPAPALRPDETALTASHAEKESGQGGLFTRANLTDFQPPDELRIRIVKRSNEDEN
jgi:hypothetical protein